MLGIALALAGTATAAVEATGMEPQLRIIRQEAARRGWPVICVGHAGEEGVIRIGVPPGTPRATIDSFDDQLMKVASSVTGLEETKSTTCDLQPRMESPESTRVLMLATGPGQKDAGLLAVAQECGYTRAYWRPTRPEDVARFGGKVDWKKWPITLDAGEDASARRGPLICFANLGLQPLVKHKR